MALMPDFKLNRHRSLVPSGISAELVRDKIDSSGRLLTNYAVFRKPRVEHFLQTHESVSV